MKPTRPEVQRTVAAAASMDSGSMKAQRSCAKSWALPSMKSQAT